MGIEKQNTNEETDEADVTELIICYRYLRDEKAALGLLKRSSDLSLFPTLEELKSNHEDHDLEWKYLNKKLNLSYQLNHRFENINRQIEVYSPYSQQRITKGLLF